MSTLYDGQGNQINVEGGDMTLSVRKLLSFNDWPQYNGNIVGTTGKWNNVSSSEHKVRVIEISGGEKIVIAGEKNGMVSVTTSFSDPVQGGNAPTLATGMSYNATFATLNGTTLPSDARYLIIQILGGTSNSCVPTVLTLNGLDYILSVREELTDLHYGNGVNWVQFGDSITEKYYSYFDEHGDAHASEAGRELVWPKLVSDINKWAYTNKGSGGQGWRYHSGSGTPGYERIREIADYTPYNLVTFAYGCNDFKSDYVSNWGSLSDSYTYSENMTPSTFVEAMRYSFDYVLSKNPAIKIIVITPFNMRNYQYNFGDDSTCWARGYEKDGSGTTLDDFADLMISVCDEYGIEYIDATRFSCINKANIVQMLPDGVHPSKDCHKILAREMAQKLNFS